MVLSLDTKKKIALILALITTACIMSALLGDLLAEKLAEGSTVPAVQTDHAMIIDGVIQRANLIPLGKRLIEMSQGDSPRFADIVINSPGGEVVTGLLFINMMEEAKANGLTIRCFVPTVAASMAFSILAHCSENHRFVLNKSLLLWHGARVMVGGLMGEPLTAEMAQLIAEDLERTNSVILQDTSTALKIDREVVRHHFLAETLHIGSNLSKLAPKFCTSYDAIPNLFETMMNRSTLRSSKPQDDLRRILGGQGEHRTNYEIIYIWNGGIK